MVKVLIAAANIQSLHRAWVSHIAIIGKLHILREIQSFDGGDVPEIKEPDVGQNSTLKNKTCDDSAENINVYLEVRRCINNCQLR